ncbi:MAG: DUF4767 domain-containing protein [Vagococcus sp.]|uniref:DUF4767 domain-containing protein n=1 Tax=Vagococcus sp. TaxID=1933889 RepID=UPI002FCA2CCA
MKKRYLLVCVTGILFLTACQSKVSSPPSKEKSQETSTKVEKASESTSEEKNTLWNKKRKKELDEAVNKWGESVNQKLTSYTPDDNLDWYGVEVPKEILNETGTIKAAIEADELSIGWSKDGMTPKGKERSLVAVYSNAFNQPYDKKYLYFFTILADGTPEVLMSTQSQGNEITSYIYFSPVEDQQLLQGFADILDYQGNIETKKKSEEPMDLKTFAMNHNDGNFPLDGYLLQGEEGVTYYINDNVPSEKDVIIAVLRYVQDLSYELSEEVGTGIPVKVKEPNRDEYSTTVVDGNYTQANHVFGRIIQGIE